MIHFIGLAGATLIATGLAAWTWPRTVMDSLVHQRVAAVATVWMFSLGGLLFAFMGYPVVTTAALAGIALALAIVRGRRLHAAALPEGEARGRVRFEGTAHAIGDPVQLPSVAKLDCVAWLVRQGDRRWASDARFEVRSGERRVLVEPSGTTSLDSPWRAERFTLRAIADEVGAGKDKLLRVWMVHEGEPVVVVGEPTLEDDDARPGYREPARLHRFSTAVIARGTHATAMRAVHGRLAIAIVLGAAAGAIAFLR